MNKVSQKINHVLTHPLARGSMIVFAGSMLTNVGAYLYHLIVGRMLGPEKYGELASLFSLSYLLNVPALVVQTVIAKQVATYTVKGQDGKAKRLIVKATRMLGLVSFVVLVCVIPFYGHITRFLHVQDIWSVVYMVAASAVFFLAMILTAALQGYQKFTQVAIYGNISIFLRLAGGILGATSGVMMTTLANLITTIAGYGLTLIPLRFLHGKKMIPTGLSVAGISKYALPSLLSILGITSLYSTDVILVKHFFSAFDAGMYAALAMMGKVIFFAGSSVGFVLFPAVAKRTESGSATTGLIYVSLAVVTVISAGLTGLYFLFPEFALGLLFGSSYVSAAKYLGLFGVFITFFSLSSIISTALLGMGKTAGWKYLLGAAGIQIVGIILYHSDITQVLTINIITCATLTAVLLLYYRHERV